MGICGATLFKQCYDILQYFAKDWRFFESSLMLPGYFQKVKKKTFMLGFTI